MLTFTTNCMEDDCHFEHCRYYKSGKCLHYSNRLNCLAIALRVLCAEASEKAISEKISENKKDFPIDDE